jgi:hypothetical protein
MTMDYETICQCLSEEAWNALKERFQRPLREEVERLRAELTVELDRSETCDCGPKEPEKPKRWFVGLSSTASLRGYRDTTIAVGDLSLTKGWASSLEKCEAIPVELAEKTREQLDMLDEFGMLTDESRLSEYCDRARELKHLWGEPREAKEEL